MVSRCHVEDRGVACVSLVLIIAVIIFADDGGRGGRLMLAADIINVVA